MASKTVPRAKVRLRLDRGTARIAHMGVEAMSCELADISEGGCQCRIQFRQMPEESAQAWKALLTVGRIVTLELTEPPELCGIVAPEAEIRWVQSNNPGEAVIGVSLRGMSPTQAKLLTQTLMTVASKKLRAKAGPTPLPQPLPAATASASLVGATGPSYSAPSAPAPQVSASRSPASVAAPARGETTTAPALSPAPVPKPRPMRTRGFENPTAPPPDPPGMPGPSATKSAATMRAVGLGSSANTPAIDIPPPTTRSTQLLNIERQRRFAAGFLVLFHITDAKGRKLDESFYEGSVIDFNEGGFLIESGAPRFTDAPSLQGTARMLATIRLPGAEMACKLEILSVKPGNSPLHWQYGVRILAMPEEDRARLRELYIRESLTTITRRKR